jgi:predicted DNA-binding transcriptional regulator YafY
MKGDFIMANLLLRCIEEKAAVEMIYLSSSGVITHRLVKPYSFDGKFLTAYCSIRKQIRTFEINNILSAQFRFLPS